MFGAIGRGMMGGMGNNPNRRPMMPGKGIGPSGPPGFWGKQPQQQGIPQGMPQGMPPFRPELPLSIRPTGQEMPPWMNQPFNARPFSPGISLQGDQSMGRMLPQVQPGQMRGLSPSWRGMFGL